MRMSQCEYDAYVNRRVQLGMANTITRLSKEDSSTPERTIQDDIEAHLKTLVPKCWYVRARMDVPTTVRKGVVDFNGWWNGKPFMMEVKRPGHKPTVEQSGELLWGKLSGAKTGVVHSLEEAVEFMRTLLVESRSEATALREGVEKLAAEYTRLADTSDDEDFITEKRALARELRALLK